MRSRIKQSKLHSELRSAGADDSEIDELSTIATNLSTLHTSSEKRSRLSFVPLGVTAMVSLLIGAFLVSLSQTSLPNSVLYPVKKASDHIAVSVDPNFRGVIMMQRAQEVQRLVAEHASTKIVLASLAGYQSEASAYKSDSTNYSVFEFCKTNLRQAEAEATGPQRQAIQSTLSSLNDV